MQEKVRGIVLRTVKYGDTSLIVDMFTEAHGRQSFMTSISRSKRTTRTVSLWQPLSMVEFTADLHSAYAKLPRPKDAYTYYNYIDLSFSPVKSSLALFLAEFLSAALREEKENAPLYTYIESSLKWLDTIDAPSSMANFHLVFLMHLTRFIGIYPNLDHIGTNVGVHFDLISGTFCSGRPSHSHYLKPEEASRLPHLFRMNYSTMHIFRFSRSERMRILTVLNDYYRLHVPSFPELKSLDVLHELFD